MSNSKQSKTKQTTELPDAFSLFKPSWQALRLNLDTFVLQLLFPVGLAILAVLLFESANRTDAVVMDILATSTLAIAFCVGLFVTAALIITELASVRQQRISLAESIQETRRYFWRLVSLFLLSCVIVVVGFILLIVPGVFAIQRLLLSPYLLVDQNVGVFEAIKRSNALTKANGIAVWGVVGVLLAINIVSLIPIFGWIVATTLSIVYFCAPAVRYLQITNRS